MGSIGSFIQNYDEDPAEPSLEEVKRTLMSAVKIGTQPQQVVQCLALYDIRNVLLQIRDLLREVPQSPPSEDSMQPEKKRPGRPPKSSS